MHRSLGVWYSREMEISLQGGKAENKSFVEDEATWGGRRQTIQVLLVCIKVIITPFKNNEKLHAELILNRVVT